jgi:two-component system, OmpR family, response regulator MtrA
MARILIADDDAEVRQGLVVALVDQGHEVAAVLDGHKAIAALCDVTPDLILLDVTMPGKDGFQVLEELNGSGFRDLTRVLMLTASGSEQDASKAFELGADAYVTKPFDPVEVVGQVERLMALSSEELRTSRERELDRSRLLSQLESILGEG